MVFIASVLYVLVVAVLEMVVVMVVHNLKEAVEAVD
jgi:hypothetical protein